MPMGRRASRGTPATRPASAHGAVTASTAPLRATFAERLSPVDDRAGAAGEHARPCRTEGSPARRPRACASTLAPRACGRQNGRVRPSRLPVPRCLVYAVGFAAAPLAAQQEARAPAAGAPVALAVFFWHDAPNDEAAFEGIEQGLVAGRVPHSFRVWRADSDEATAKRQLAEIAASDAKLVFAMGTKAARLARAAIGDRPIVFTAVTHPVESGVAESWERAGGNVCGNSNWIESAKMLQAFRVAVPGLTRLGIVRSAKNPVSTAELRQMATYLREPGAPRVELADEIVDDAGALAAATARLRAHGVQAVWVPIDDLVYENTALVLESLRGSGIPVVSSAQRGAATGAALGVVVDYRLLGERAAALARRILVGGAAPADLPVGRMQSYQIIVNPAAAERCGYELPLGALAVADRILDHVEAPGR